MKSILGLAWESYNIVVLTFFSVVVSLVILIPALVVGLLVAAVSGRFRRFLDEIVTALKEWDD